MSKGEDMRNSVSLGSLMGEEQNVANFVDDDPVIVEEQVTNPDPINDGMLNFIAPEAEQFDEMRKGDGATGPKIPTPRENYISFLIDNQGLTLSEATREADKVYPLTTENPSITGTGVSPVRNDTKAEVVVVNIDKENASKVEFTDDEKEKLIVAKAIRMNVLEDESLRSIKVKHSAGIKKKISFMESYAGKLNQYSIPMMNTGDFATFKAAKAYEITMALVPESKDQNLSEWYAKRASFMYEKFVSSTGYPELEPGKKPTYTQFINHFKFDDMDAGLFAISLSTLNATDVAHVKCSKCENEFDETYKLESLFNVNYRPDVVKENMDKIVANKYNREIMTDFVATKDEHVRLKSEETGMVFELFLPSIAEMIEMSKSFKSTVETDGETFESIEEYVASHVFAIYVPMEVEDEEGNISIEYELFGRDLEYENTHSYPYDTDEYDPTDDILNMIKLLPQGDYELLLAYVNALVSKFDQIVDIKCPNCGNSIIFGDSIINKVFTMARGEKTLRDINPGKLLSL